MTAAWGKRELERRAKINSLAETIGKIRRIAPRIDTDHLRFFESLTPEIWWPFLAANTQVTAHLAAWLDIYEKRLRELESKLV